MGGTGSMRVRPLWPSDPVELGAYRIVGRLGEGGMGRVYLAESADGRQVALKVIRAELADDEFRRRFRGEVARARQVPPFCTAEVLEADTEHDPPYLVVEYVDGPSLSYVVAERGPLTPANQHGLAVGVAVALTAIHGAGVIHRDLKPSNVLLAPGSPKVIDFGIARAIAGTDFETRTNQMVGTVAYMAPERFESKAVTPAADIFAWGALIAYAGTGRTPFAADTPAATAIRIMTAAPDLEGLTGSLRELVEWTLAKDPGERPLARDLLDHLLAGGSRSAARPASFAQQPEVLAAAGFAGLGSGTPAAPAGPTVLVPTLGQPAAEPATVRIDAGPTEAGATVPVMPPPPPRPPVSPPRPGPGPGPPPTGRRGARLAITALALSVLLLSGAVAAFLTGVLPLGGASGAPTGTGPAVVVATSPTQTTSATTSTSASAGPGDDGPVAPGATIAVRDSLAAPRLWKNTTLATYAASCTLDGRLRATLGKRQAGSFRCRGVVDVFSDFTVKVDVTLGNPDSCAGLWFRFAESTGGYVLSVCRDRLQLWTHVGSAFTPLTSTYDATVPPGDTVRLAIRADGPVLRFFLDDALVLDYSDVQFTSGKVVLGVLPFFDSQAAPPFEVSFANVEIWRAPSGG